MTYLVTGASGFVGNVLVKALEAQGHDVVALVRSAEKAAIALAGCRCRLVFGDVTDTAYLEKMFEGASGEIIFVHAASIVYIGGDKAKLAQMHDVNIKGAQNVVDVCVNHKVRLVYVSSVHAIPERARPIVEVAHFDVGAVKGGYAKSKAGASGIVLGAVKWRGLDAVIVHPSGIIGPNDFTGTHMTQMVEMFRNNKLPACVTGGYDFVDVRDVADGIIAAAAVGRTGECYLLTNRYYTCRELFDRMYKLGMGKRVSITCPLWLARFGLLFLRFKNPLFTRYSLRTLASNVRFSHDKATRELGYNPREILTEATRW